MRRFVRFAIAGIVGATLLGAGLHSASAAGTSSITGVAFQDLNRNGVQDNGEAPFAGHRLYLLDAAGPTFVSSTVTGSDGRYEFNGLTDGATYIVQSSQASWESIRNDWVPTTTGGLRPRRTTTANGAVVLDFGWRPIVRSTTVGRPISQYVGPSGLTVESYDDVLQAQAIHDNLLQGSLALGPEASTTVIRSGLGTTSATTTSTAITNGKYSDFTAVVSIAYAAWLDNGDRVLFHEYGHAWSLYYALIVQQDSSMSGYLQARGLQGDSRVNSSYGWSAREMIAEDYRQLFGTANASFGGQMNTDVPLAADVPGLGTYLRDTFRMSPSTTAGSTTASPTLTISGLGVNPQPVSTSGVVSFTLSTVATTTVTITKPDGSLIRVLTQGASLPSGSSSFSWDRKDARGRKVRSGTYNAVVSASSSDGQQVSRAMAFTVS